MQYLAPLTRFPFGGCFSDEDASMEGGGWPWDSVASGGGGEPRYRYSLASLSTPKPRCIGFARRRMGRGGRYVLDRAYSNYDDLWRSLDFSDLNNGDDDLARQDKMSNLNVDDSSDVIMDDDQVIIVTNPIEIIFSFDSSRTFNKLQNKRSKWKGKQYDKTYFLYIKEMELK